MVFQRICRKIILTDIQPFVKDTTALIFGWAGSQPRYVQAYNKIYANELGIGAYGYTLPMEYTFSYDQSTQRKIAQRCLNVIKGMFSNNVQFYTYI